MMRLRRKAQRSRALAIGLCLLVALCIGGSAQEEGSRNYFGVGLTVIQGSSLSSIVSGLLQAPLIPGWLVIQGEASFGRADLLGAETMLFIGNAALLVMLQKGPAQSYFGGGFAGVFARIAQGKNRAESMNRFFYGLVGGQVLLVTDLSFFAQLKITEDLTYMVTAGISLGFE